MGNCCSYKFSTNNIYENFILEVLFDLKIRKYNFNEIHEFYNKATLKNIIDDNGIIKEITLFSEENYNFLLKKLFIENKIQSNPYYIIQLNLFPSYNDFLNDDPEYLLLYKTICFVFKNDIEQIYKNLETLIKIRYSQEEELRYFYFFDFIKQYITKNIIEIPHKIISTLEFIYNLNRKDLINFNQLDKNRLSNIDKDDLDNFLTIQKSSSMNKNVESFNMGQFHIDQKFLENLNKYSKGFKNVQKIEKIIKLLEEGMQQILKDDKLINNKSFDEIIIKFSHIEKFNEKFLWLWDIIELREYYFNLFQND